MLAPTGRPLARGSDPISRSVRAQREGGFVLSLEFLLLLSIFMIVIVAGLVYLQHWLINLKMQKVIRSVRVYEANGILIGEAVAFDTTEAPLILFRDPNFGNVLLGVKPTRFTSFQSVYFDGANCSGNAYILDPNVGALEGSGMQALQAYWWAMGPYNKLYRTNGPPPQATGTVAIRSRWHSQAGDLPPAPAPGRPCEDLQQNPPVNNPVNVDYLAPASIYSDFNIKYPSQPYFIPTDAQEKAAIDAAAQALPTSEVTSTGPDTTTYSLPTGEK